MAVAADTTEAAVVVEVTTAVVADRTVEAAAEATQAAVDIAKKFRPEITLRPGLFLRNCFYTLFAAHFPLGMILMLRVTFPSASVPPISTKPCSVGIKT